MSSTERVRLREAVRLGRLTGTASRLLRRGSGGTVAGRIARSVCPDVLARLCEGRDVVLLSGTNGKTTTTAYLAAALATAGPVTTNGEGNNLLNGLVSALLAPVASVGPVVLEVDEAVVPTALEQTRAKVVVLLNLSRDQLDRYAEVRSHLRRWADALRARPDAAVVANVDDPLVVGAVLAGRPAGANVVWVSAGSAWRSDSSLCPVCGHALTGGATFRCTWCDFARPEAAWELDEAGLRGPQGVTLAVDLALPGAGNRGNAGLAVAAAGLFGVEPSAALQAIARIAVVQGRYRHSVVDGRPVQLRLAKNPAGWADSLQTLLSEEQALIIAINAQGADGTDPSWLWDVPFEQLAGSVVVATGERRHDLAVRLRYAGVDCTTAADIPHALAALPPGPAVIIGNYTAFQQARGWLDKAAQ